MKFQSALYLCSVYLSAQTAFATLQAQPMESKFDDLGNAPLAVKAIGRYQGLQFNVINLGTLGAGGTVVSGVVPKSGFNVGAYSARTIALADNRPPTMTRNFDGSTTVSFDLKSFYYGCAVASAAGAIGASLNCTVTAEGFRGGKSVATQPFTYKEAKPVGKSPMVQAKLSDKFKNLSYVTFRSTYNLAGIPVDLLGATLLDSVVHTNYRQA